MMIDEPTPGMKQNEVLKLDELRHFFSDKILPSLPGKCILELPHLS